MVIGLEEVEEGAVIGRNPPRLLFGINEVLVVDPDDWRDDRLSSSMLDHDDEEEGDKSDMVWLISREHEVATICGGIA